MPGHRTGKLACIIGWSVIDFFVIFENGHYAAEQVYCPKPKYMRIWPRSLGACSSKFSLSKNHRDLKNGYFL